MNQRINDERLRSGSNLNILIAMSKLKKIDLEQNGYISNKTHSVYDYRFVELLQSVPWRQWFEGSEGVRCQEEYLEYYHSWVLTSQLARFNGLDNFKMRHLINGTTQTFDEAYLRHAHRRLRFFRGEYAYHRRISQNWKFIEDEPLGRNDYVIVSTPFCSTGDLPEGFYPLLDDACRLEVPVIIDCAYFGTCESFELNLDYSCIESVNFSLSKGLGLGDIRSGIRFSNLDDNFPICQQNKYQHNIHAAAKVGLFMMKNLDPDFIPNKYSAIQKEVCRDAGLIPTKCMHLAIGDGSNQWDDYLIDQKFQRVGIRYLVKARAKGLI